NARLFREPSARLPPSSTHRRARTARRGPHSISCSDTRRRVGRSRCKSAIRRAGYRDGSIPQLSFVGFHSSAFTSSSFISRLSFLDGGSHEVSPLSPGPIVVLDVFEPEQVLQYEPGMARAFADAAIGDHRLVAVDALGTVQRHQLVDA